MCLLVIIIDIYRLILLIYSSDVPNLISTDDIEKKSLHVTDVYYVL